MLTIKTLTSDGRPFPDFLLEHIRSEWGGVQLAEIDPDICLKVDSALSYCGCVRPTPRLRQLVYLYQQSSDFDHETVGLLTRVATHVDDESEIWDEIVAIELQRDCGLSRADYLVALAAIVERVEADAVFVEELMSA